MTSSRPADWVALFGGTFDPPHHGHREAVRGLFVNPGVGRVKILPSAIPPLKSSHATPDQRAEMVRIAFASYAGNSMPAEVEIDLRELARAVRAPGEPSYTFDTLRELAREIPAERLAFVIGADQIIHLDRWHRFPEILGLCHWIILERKPRGAPEARGLLKNWAASGLVRSIHGSDSLWQTPSGREIRICPTSAPELSSTRIREILAKTGQVPENSVLSEIESYLKTHRIYAIKTDSSTRK